MTRLLARPQGIKPKAGATQKRNRPLGAYSGRKTPAVQQDAGGSITKKWLRDETVPVLPSYAESCSSPVRLSALKEATLGLRWVHKPVVEVGQYGENNEQEYGVFER
jgi:hypothetical protein